MAQDRGAFGEHPSVLGQRRNAAAIVDREVFRLPLVARREVELVALVGQPGFLQDDVGGERAGAGGVVEGAGGHGVAIQPAASKPEQFRDLVANFGENHSRSNAEAS